MIFIDTLFTVGEKAHRKQPKYPTMKQQLAMIWQDTLRQICRDEAHMEKFAQKIPSEKKVYIYIFYHFHIYGKYIYKKLLSHL